MQRHQERPHRTHSAHTAPSSCLGDGWALSFRAAAGGASHEKTSLRIARSVAIVGFGATDSVGLHGRDVDLTSLPDAYTRYGRPTVVCECLEVAEHHPV